MKKSEQVAIRAKVESATKKHMPSVIDNVARGKAYDKVHEAMYEEPADDADKVQAAAQPAAASAPRPMPMTPAMHAANAGRK